MTKFIFPKLDMHVADVNGHKYLIGPFPVGFTTSNNVGIDLIKYCEGRSVDECKQWIAERYGADNVSAVDNLASIVEKGFFDKLGFETQDVTHEPPPVDVIHISLTHKCQMACQYCFAHSNRVSSECGDVSFDTACSAMKYFIDKSVETGLASLSVAFNTTGEGLLKLQLMLEIADYGKKYAISSGIQLHLYCLTNGLLLDNEVMQQLWDAGIIVSLSWDGPPEIHNRQRTLPDGSGTYDSVNQAFKTIMDFGKYHPLIGVTPTSLDPDLSGIFNHLHDMGVRMLLMKPVRAANSDIGVTEKTLPAFKAAYAEFVELLLKEDSYHTERLITLYSTDFFWRFVHRVVKREFNPYRCPGARSMMCVDTNGDIYPCQDFIGMSQYKLGDVFSGIDINAQRPYMEDLLSYKMESCKDCWARYWCGGACPALSAHAYDRLDAPYLPDCELTKYLIELAVYFVTIHEKRHPGLLGYVFNYHDLGPAPNERSVALCHKVNGSSLLSRPIEDWRSPDPILLDDASQAGGIKKWQGYDDLNASIHLKWDENYLYVLGEVHHDTYTPPSSINTEWWFYDCLRIALDPKKVQGISTDPCRLTGDYREFGITSMNGTATCFDCHIDQRKPTARWQGSVEHSGDLTIYKAAIPWQCISDNPPILDEEFGFTTAVIDSNGKSCGWLQWTPGITKAKVPWYFGLIKFV
ncbi:MAG: SPASM domain-containing protein [Armatimonadota bacterium]